MNAAVQEFSAGVRRNKEKLQWSFISSKFSFGKFLARSVLRNENLPTHSEKGKSTVNITPSAIKETLTHLIHGDNEWQFGFVQD